MKTSLLLAAVGVVCLPMLSSDPAQAQATRTWVSGVGDDANPCSRTAPCKTFAGAISKTAAGGEIDCLDPGGFGAVTITKNMTIDCNGVSGGILAAGTNGVNVNAAGIVVVLRNLTIQGATTGLIGINFISGSSLVLQNVVIQGFNAGSALGIKFSPSTVAQLVITDSTVDHNGVGAAGGGILVQPAAGGVAFFSLNRVSLGNNSIAMGLVSSSGAITGALRDSVVSNSTSSGVTSVATSAINFMVDRTTIESNVGAGLTSSGANSTVRIGNSTVHGNNTGVSAVSGGIVQSFKNNQIAGNNTDSSPPLPLTAVPGISGTLN